MANTILNRKYNFKKTSNTINKPGNTIGNTIEIVLPSLLILKSVGNTFGNTICGLYYQAFNFDFLLLNPQIQSVILLKIVLPVHFSLLFSEIQSVIQF